MTITIEGPIELCGQELNVLCTAEVYPPERATHDYPGCGPSVAHSEVIDSKSRAVLALTPAQEIELDEMVLDKYYESDDGPSACDESRGHFAN